MLINFKNYNKGFVLFVIVCLFFLAKICNADSEGGHTTIIKNVRGKATKSVPEMFVSKAITGTSTYIYNQVGSSTVNDGWVDVSGYDGVSVALSVPIYYSGTISARIEALVGSSTLNAEVTSVNFTATSAIADLIGPILENMTKIRVGWIVSSSTGSGTVNTSLYCSE